MPPVIFFFLLLGLAAAFSIIAAPLPLSPSLNRRHHHFCPSSGEIGGETAACPPFHRPPSSFPFAATSGCGHPSFQVHCSLPHSTISINSSRFQLLSLLPNNSLLLSLLSLPSSPIDFSGTPFRLSDDTCKNLSILRHCNSHSNLSTSFNIFSSCSSYSSEKLGSCVASNKDSLKEFLAAGIRVVWKPNDIYFTKCSACNGSCGFDDSDPSKPFLCLPISSSSSPSDANRRLFRHGGAAAAVVAGIFSIVLVIVFGLILSAVLLAQIRRDKYHSATDLGAAAGQFLREHRAASSVSLPATFSYEELNSATNGFDPRYKIGDGGFGSVYLARLAAGHSAAVKRLHRGCSIASSSFCNEIVVLSSLRHPNLVSLHGYCCDSRGLFLVYDYAPNGTLADHLHRHSGGRSTLTWAARVGVAVQTASAMEYLHFSVKPPVAHRDITSSNIFLDQNMSVKLGDFGLSRLLVPPSSGEEYPCWTGPQGTPGYVDPEYERSSRLTEKSDVYSFGVVLMELVTGKKALDVSGGGGGGEEFVVVGAPLSEIVVAKIQVGELRRVVDPTVIAEGDRVIETVEAVAELAFRCVAGEKDDRPDAREVYRELRRISDQVKCLSTTVAS